MTQEFTEQLAKWEMHLHQLGYRKVVLCKDCKRFNQGYCTKFLIVCLKPIDYCSRAERKTDDA